MLSFYLASLADIRYVRFIMLSHVVVINAFSLLLIFQKCIIESLAWE